MAKMERIMHCMQQLRKEKSPTMVIIQKHFHHLQILKQDKLVNIIIQYIKGEYIEGYSVFINPVTAKYIPSIYNIYIYFDRKKKQRKHT